MTPPITSLSNPRIKELLRLRQRRQRDRTGTFLIEGYRELTRALTAGVELADLYVCPDLFLGSNEPALVRAAEEAGVRVHHVADRPFRRASYRDRPEGLLAVGRQFDTSLAGWPAAGPELILVVEGIEKPGNLGTMLRTADAAGAGVIVTDPTTDPFNPNVVRASLGCLFEVSLAVAAGEEARRWLRVTGFRVVATSPAAPLRHYEVDLRGPVAVVVGSEQYGLSELWLEGADLAARIPMAGSSDSLNAAMAAGIVLFEAVRQRSGSQPER